MVAPTCRAISKRLSEKICDDDLRRTAAAAHCRHHHADGARADDKHRLPKRYLRPAYRVSRHGQRFDQRPLSRK